MFKKSFWKVFGDENFRKCLLEEELKPTILFESLISFLFLFVARLLDDFRLLDLDIVDAHFNLAQLGRVNGLVLALLLAIGFFGCICCCRCLCSFFEKLISFLILSKFYRC